MKKADAHLGAVDIKWRSVFMFIWKPAAIYVVFCAAFSALESNSIQLGLPVLIAAIAQAVYFTYTSAKRLWRKYDKKLAIAVRVLIIRRMPRGTYMGNHESYTNNLPKDWNPDTFDIITSRKHRRLNAIDPQLQQTKK